MTDALLQANYRDYGNCLLPTLQTLFENMQFIATMRRSEGNVYAEYHEAYCITAQPRSFHKFIQLDTSSWF